MRRFQHPRVRDRSRPTLSRRVEEASVREDAVDVQVGKLRALVQVKGGEPAESNVLFRTDHDPSADPIAWTRTYEDSRVFAYQSGHGGNAYTDTNFRTLLTRGIWWSAGRDAVGVKVV